MNRANTDISAQSAGTEVDGQSDMIPQFVCEDLQPAKTRNQIASSNCKTLAFAYAKNLTVANALRGMRLWHGI